KRHSLPSAQALPPNRLTSSDWHIVSYVVEELHRKPLAATEQRCVLQVVVQVRFSRPAAVATFAKRIAGHHAFTDGDAYCVLTEVGEERILVEAMVDDYVVTWWLGAIELARNIVGHAIERGRNNAVAW